MKSFPIIAAAALVLSGCVTAYQAEGFTGGYSETQLAPDVFRVNFKGNGYTPSDRASDYAMLRAAELTLNHGFTHFALLNETDSVSHSAVTTPGYAYTTGSVGSSGFYTANTTFVPGQTVVYHKPKTALLIRCFRGAPHGGGAFDARFLANSIRQKYKLQPR